jgi:hypothetical protein
MAGRKAEPGISYYKMNCGHTINKKVRLLFNEFDANGYWIWQCIIDYAYSQKGYYFDCNDPDALELFATDVCKKQVSLVNQVISGCLRRGLFDKTVFDMFGVLSSVMMQEIYLDATYERRRKGTEIELFGEFVLINIPADAVNISIVPWNKPILPRKNENVPGRNATDKSIVKNSKVEDSIIESNGVVPPVAPRKKTSVKNSKKEEEPPEPHWQQIVDLWFCFYKEKFKIKPSFKDQDPKLLKKIIVQLKKRAEDKNVEWTEENALNRLKLFLEHAYARDWLKENFLLKNLHDQFDVIITKKTSAKQNSAPEKFSIPLTQAEKQINSLYSIFLTGKMKISDMYDADYDFMIKRGMQINESQNNSIKGSVREYIQKEKLASDQSVIQSLLKRFAVIEHFKYLKQKGNVTVFEMD